MNNGTMMKFALVTGWQDAEQAQWNFLFASFWIAKSVQPPFCKYGI
jgi:hypothetical protein